MVKFKIQTFELLNKKEPWNIKVFKTQLFENKPREEEPCRLTERQGEKISGSLFSAHQVAILQMKVDDVDEEADFTNK